MALDPAERLRDMEDQERVEAAEREERERVFEGSEPENVVRLNPPSIADVNALALAPLVTEEIPEDALEAFVQQLDIDRLPPTVIRLRQISAAANKLADRLEARWSQDTGGLGWREPTSERVWTFRGSSTRKWFDIPALLAELTKEGISLRTIGEAISEMRVTDLKEAARLFQPEKEKRLVELLEEHRGPHHGIPHFKELED